MNIILIKIKVYCILVIFINHVSYSLTWNNSRLGLKIKNG